MKVYSPDRTGLLVVSLWIEVNPQEGFRARITQTLDSAGKERTTATAATPEGIYAAVRSWVEGFIGQAPDAGGAGSADAADIDP